MINGTPSNGTHPDPDYTVGVLIDSVDSFFSSRTVSDLIDAADETGLHLVFFFGGAIEKSSTAGPYSFIYTLPDHEIIQALIVLPHSIAPWDPRNSIKLILEQYPDIPVYSFFAKVPGCFSVRTSEAQAIGVMFRHLTRDHAYTRFAVLTGPNASDTLSRARLDLIRSALAENGAALSDDLVYSGAFTEEDGRQTARKILSLTGEAPEVLVCLNDQMAIGAIREFVGNGISVPEDIAVVGFDDVEENTSLLCTFSTINFPVWEMICAITDRIVSDLSGRTVYAPELIEMQAQFMHRESCGCTSFFEQHSKQEIEFIPLEQPRSSHGSLKKVALFRRSLEDVLEECISSGNITVFNDFMQDAIRTLARSGNLSGSFIDTFSTQWTVSLLRHTDFNTQTLINSLFVDAFRLLLQKKMQNFSRIHANDLGSLSFYQSCNDLQTRNLSINGAIEGIGANISKLGIFSCILVFISPENPDMGEIRLNYRENRYLIIPKDNYTTFPLRKLLPAGINSVPGHSAILTLAHNNSVYGYLVLSIAEKHFEQFSMIQEVVSHILDSAMSNDLLSSHIKNLTLKNDVLSRLSVIDEPTGLNNRRALYVTGRNMFQQAVDSRQASAFIFMDMDGLKKINDNFGHAEGDAAILALANTLKKCFRENDLLVRYGGDEFVVVMINIQESVVQKALLRITAEFESFNASKQHPWTLAASWGYVYNPENVQPDTFESIIEQSDARLYEEKRKRKKDSPPPAL